LITKTKTSETKTPKGEITMAELLAKAKSKVNIFTKGQRVEAILLTKSPTLITFDIGGKSEGLVKEKAYTDAKEFIETLKVGDKVLATVLVPETRDGTIILALKDAIRDISWVDLEKAKEKGLEKQSGFFTRRQSERLYPKPNR